MSLRDSSMGRIRFRFDDRTLIINNEVCAIITGFDKYAVSMHGNVYNIKTCKQLKLWKKYAPKCKYDASLGKKVSAGTGEKRNYYTVNVFLYDNNGKRYQKQVHRLVAQEWLVDTELNPNGTSIVGRKCVNHKDHNTANNNVFNLEWCDINYNNKN